MNPLPLDKLNKMFGTKHKKADPKAERKKQMRKKRFDTKLIAAGFCVALVVLVAVSVAIVISEKDDSSSAETSAQATAALLGASADASQATVSEEELALDANILLAFTEDGNEGLELLSIVSIDSANERLSMSYIPVSTLQQVNNFSGTMKEHIENGGIQELLLAVSEYAGLEVDRYICLDEADFVDLMKEIGEFDVDIADEINHEYNGINFIIDEGKNTFAPDAMLRYVVYLCQTLSSDTKPLTDIVSEITKRLIVDEQGNKITSQSYEAVVNYVDTDISAMDIVNYTQAITGLSDGGVLNNIVVEPDIGNLKEEQ